MNIQKGVQLFCDYSQQFRGYAPRTIRKYHKVVKQYSQFADVNYISDITEENVTQFFRHGRSERKWQTSTFITFYNTLRVFFKWCIKQQYLEQHPMRNIDKPTLEKKLPPKFTRYEAMRLLEVIENYPYRNKFIQSRNYAMFATYIFAGLRLNELLHLKYMDVDLENMTIYIHQGKGNKDRIIPILPKLADILTKYVITRRIAKKTCPEFFTSTNRNCAFTSHGMKHLVEEFKKATDFKFTIHKLRHTFATLMIEGGCDIYSLSKMMGHSSILTTTIYLAASVEHLRNQITKHPLNT